MKASSTAQGHVESVGQTSTMLIRCVTKEIVRLSAILWSKKLARCNNCCVPPAPTPFYSCA